MAFELTLSELAAKIDGHIVRGELDLRLDGIAALDAAGPTDISFLGNEKYHGQFLASKAGVVLVSPAVTDGRADMAVIHVENPSLAFAEVVRHFAVSARAFAPGIHPSAVVHPSVRIDPEKVRVQAGAVIEEGAVIGDGCDIGPNCVIGTDAVLGESCWLHANVSVRERCVLGQRVIVQPGAVIGSDGFGYEFSNGRHVKIDQVGIVEVGDDVEIGANSTIDRARFGKTCIGAGSKIDNLVQIGHNVVIGNHCLVVSQTGISGSAKLGDYVTIGGQVGVGGHVTIGDRAILTARTGVTASLEGGQVYAGKPAQLLRDELKGQARVRRLERLAERLRLLEAQLSDRS